MRLLCIGDSPKNTDGRPCAILKEAIKTGSMTLYMSGKEGVVSAFRSYSPDIAVIQQPTPSTGFIRAIRNCQIQTPIFIIARHMPPHTVSEALDAGADDCGSIEMSPDELLSRLKAIVRRANTLYGGDEEISLGRLSLKPKGKMAFVDGKDLSLTYSEYDILALLVSRKGGTLSKENVLAFLYEGKSYPISKTVDVMMSRLRRKFSNVGIKNALKTKWGVGYYIDETPLRPLGARDEDVYQSINNNEMSMLITPGVSSIIQNE